MNSVVITFDDAFQDFLDNAYPVLVKMAVSCTIFVPEGLMGKHNVWDSGYNDHEELRIMSEEMIKDLSKQDLVEVGSHGIDHVSLGKMSKGEMRRQIYDSKKNLENLISQPVHAFAYPYGQRDDVPRDAVRLVAEAGYSSAVTGQWGTFESPGHLLMKLPRIFFREDDSDQTIREKIEGRYDWIKMKERIGFLLRTLKGKLSRGCG
jgi:peptidoglycan/xylan/chitin deacetylase (PgdA/CDA1 family)